MISWNVISEDGWPFNSGWYIVTLFSNGQVISTVAKYYKDSFFNDMGEVIDNDVIAWTYLPEPYSGNFSTSNESDEYGGRK